VISVVPFLIGPGLRHDLGSLPARPLNSAIDVFNAASQIAEGIAKIVSDHGMEKSHGYPPVAIG
jgi:hypothetical protein